MSLVRARDRLTPGYALRSAVIVALYYVSARVGLALGALPGNVTPVWPPTGIALAALFLWGEQYWPAVVVAALMVNGLGPLPFPAAIGMAIGNTLEGVVGARLLRRYDFHPGLDRLRDVRALLLVAGAATVISATVGVASLWAAGVTSTGALATTWRVWWVGDAVGCLVVAPFAFAWRHAQRTHRHWIEVAAIGATIFALRWLVFGSSFRSVYLLFPLIIWAAVRFTQRGAATASMLMSIAAIVKTAEGLGPFSGPSAVGALWRLDTFLAVVVVTGLVLAIVVTDRDRIQATLEANNRDLDQRVRARTAELDRDRNALAEAQRVARLGSFEWSLATDRIEWSEEMYRLWGMQPEDWNGTFAEYLERIHPDDRELVQTLSQKAVEQRQPYAFEHRVVLPDGSNRWLHCRGQMEWGADGNVVRLYGTAQDVTDRREAESRFEGLLESAPDGIVVVDGDGIIRLVNRQTEALFGYERSELVGQPLEILIPTRLRGHHPDLRGRYFDNPNTRPMGAGIDLAARRRDGTEFPVDISLSPMETEHGTLVSASIRDVTERRQAEAAIAYQATHDAITGLPNRTLLDERLSHALRAAAASGRRIAVLFLDVDRFKVINDSLGHSAGDELVGEIGRRLARSVRGNETVARFGGDEFVIVAELEEGVTPEALAARVMQELRPPILLGGTEVRVTASIGVAIAGPGDAAEALLRDADAAMYRAKEQGRDCVVTFDTAMRAAANERLRTENDLRRAIDNADLITYYQPIVELTTGQVVGVEALARWKDAERGIIEPAEFIALAEETGMIVALGEAVLREACGQVATWNRERPHAPISVSVNLSARQLLGPGMAELVATVLAESGLDPSLLCLEITESVLLADAAASARALRALKTSGIRIGVDDFGTGYSSLTYLKRFPVDVLKIDKSFIGDLGDRQGDGAIVASLIDLAHAFGLTTVAEGVETDEQLAYLLALGCELGQGHRWSPALRPADARQWIDAASAALPEVDSALEPAGAARVLVVDDDRRTRAAIRLALEVDPDFRVVAEAADGRQAAALARHYQPDLVLLDLAMPGMGGFEALPLIKAAAPATRVVVLSALDAGETTDRARALGAAGYYCKADGLDGLADYATPVTRPARASVAAGG